MFSVNLHRDPQPATSMTYHTSVGHGRVMRSLAITAPGIGHIKHAGVLIVIANKNKKREAKREAAHDSTSTSGRMPWEPRFK